MTYQDGNVYDGPFVYGKKQGENGTMTFAANGDKYVGQWNKDQPNGKGKYYFATNERYEGDFVNGTFEGQGTMYYPDGARFTGGWSKNRKNGTGVFYAADGREKRGTWAMGKPVRIRKPPCANRAKANFNGPNNKGNKPSNTRPTNASKSQQVLLRPNR